MILGLVLDTSSQKRFLIPGSKQAVSMKRQGSTANQKQGYQAK